MSAKSVDRRQTDSSGSSNKQEEDQPVVPAELESVSTRLGRLKDEVLPSAPYLLTVPTDVPFRLGNRFVNNWAVGKKGPFAIEEQQLQYMTFLMHHDADSLLVAVGDWSDNDGRAMAKQDDEKSRVATPTTPAATQSGAAKKKISLSDYKTRAKGDSTREQSADDGEPPRDGTRNEKHDTLQVPPSRTIKERTSHDRLNESANATSPSSKRPLKDSSRPVSDAPASKRARLTPPESAEEKLPADKKPNGIPALLSPTLPPTSSTPGLPELLSPTLPPELEEELAHLEDESPLTSRRETTSVSKVDSRNGTTNLKAPAHNRIRPDQKSTTNRQPKETSKTTPLPTGGKNNNTRTQDTDLRSTSPYQKSPASNTTARIKGAPSSATGTTAPKKLIVKLKYGRANRKRVGALLKFGGKRKLSDSLPSRASKESLSGDEDGDILRYESKFRERKRERSPYDDRMDEQPLQDTFGAGKTVPSDKARTSNATSFKSPSSKRPAVSKTESVAPTPVKDNRSRHQRLADADAEVKTPSSSSGGKSLPPKPDKAIQMSPANSDVMRARDQERRSWRDEYTKYTGLGRESKHTADGYSRARATGSDSVSSLGGKLAAASAIESILCFIVAFVANDRHRSIARQIGDSETWRSIIPYWRVVERTTSAYPHLHGLCLVLGAVSRDTINTLDLERLAVCPLPGEQSPVPTPGSDGNTVTSDRNNSNRSHNKKEFLDLRNRLPENHKEANRLWLEGCRKLSDDVLAKEYPETWSSRSRNFTERGHDNFKIGQYAGGFFLPFSRTTTPMETVRFGVALLREWCRKENIDFKARLKL
ncbi:hypothetical protein TMatcc_001822 [Talaromyces marneffei ATCC 18224]|uniref:Ell binding protein Ebp1 C-terminal domain-containing protein n=2 Tax=Talaromyces marneffei TaxID=37727 RepID=B6QHW1_TALMQ|nr:uncharacterized protein EYB26_006980 [Talaromyces marneffei]EEA22956.1 conserved hypothetical protein [Talaromyces marneffei ATCC 18224]KAE8551836.1 hypothetical protein EYB25_005726 [Talaromyces marneffei]QGA19291.1 hypothetical protein EYB26_006980 [Talaromyces marneffei]